MVKILDTTLRDGSYVNNFSFSAEQTSRLCEGLDQAGVDFIEVGHGVGLNASESGHGRSSTSDLEYMKAAAESVKKGKWGMFAIPGICQVSNLGPAFEHGIGFLRFGVSIEDFRKVFPFVEEARAQGVFTCVNFMKSYTHGPQVFEKAARESSAAGADIVYLVDSAGNMTPSQIRHYCERLDGVAFGFHGHNNLGLAVANALSAMESGAEVIDCSLQGMGRGAGNTMIEQFVAILQRQGHLSDIDLFSLLDLGETEIRQMLPSGGFDSVDLVSGLAGFHSSYMGIIRKFSLDFDVDPRKLILKVCEVSQADAPEVVVREKAVALRAEDDEAGYAHRFPLAKYFGNEQSSL